MLCIFSALRGMSLASVIVRMVLAVLCGGAIGLERTVRRRPAGFRTHMLICLGASMTTMISQFLMLYMHYETDPARMGAQVVAGIGFIGAGTIMVTRHQRVKGLTTAAGLWTAAIVGLALGAGFYEGALIVTVLVLLAELLLSKIERLILRKSLELNLYIHYEDGAAMDRILSFLRNHRIKILSMEITRSKGSRSKKATAIFLLRMNRKMSAQQLEQDLHKIEGLDAVELLSY